MAFNLMALNELTTAHDPFGRAMSADCAREATPEDEAAEAETDPRAVRRIAVARAAREDDDEDELAAEDAEA